MPTTAQFSGEHFSNPLALALEISSSALLNDRKEPFLKTALASIGESLHCGQVCLFEYENKTWREPLVWFNQVLEKAHGASPPADTELLAPILDILLQRKSFCATDTSLMPAGPQRDLLLQLQVKSLFCLPILYDGQLFGGICLLHRVASRQWTPEDAGICHLLGNMLAITLTHFRLYERLRHKHDQLCDILDAFVDPVYIIDMESYELLFLNKSVEASFPKPEGPMGNICYKRLQGRDSPCPFCTNAIIASRNEPYQWTYENELTKRTYTVVDKVIHWDTGHPVRLSISTDVTDLLRTQHEKQAAVIASQAKSEFLAHMSHEIRTPMNGIIGLTHLALQSDPSPEHKDYLHKIRSSATSLLAIINDILDLSKIEANKMVLENVNYTMEEVLDFVYTSIRFPLDQKGLEYICEVADDVPLKLWGDGLRLKQVLLNLLSNAVKFTSKGSVRLRIRRENSDGQDLLHFMVTDTGMGISREYQQHLFDPYTQANASIARRFGGTGLGLSICKRIAGLMRGNLWCESEPGNGSTFHLSIPCILSRKLPGACPTVQSSLPLPGGARILLVEDNEINQEIARAMLHQLGLDCDLAQNGKEAVSMALAKDYDLLLMDVRMPIMDGLTATRLIREKLTVREKSSTLPIVAMTAATLPENIDEILDAGMDDHISKPFDATVLRNKLAYWLKRR